MSKQKFDLSNPGGQPKDWMQREHEKQVESSLGFKDYLGCAGAIAALTVCIAMFAGSFFIDDLPRPIKGILASIGVFLLIYFAAKEINESLDVRRSKVDRAIENTWARATRIERELEEGLARTRSEGDLREQQLLRKIALLEERITSLERVDFDVFGDLDPPQG